MKSKIFYGWAVVAAVFVITCVSYGIAYCFAAFIEVLQAEFGATRGEISFIFALAGFVYFALGPASGAIADRVGPRWVVAFGMLTIAAGLLLTSQAQALWQVYLTYGLGIGVGVGFCYVPAIGTVQRWFAVKRGLATGLAVAGIGTGTLIMPPLAATLVTAGGWRAAYIVLALIPVVLGLPAALVLIHSPQLRGLLPDGGAQTSQTASGQQEMGPTTSNALSSRPFWLLYGASFLTSFGEYIPLAHLAPYARDHGLSEGSGVFLISVFGVASLIGRFATGGIADRFGRGRSLTVLFIAMALMLVWWACSTSFWALILFALMFGIGYGGHIAVLPAISADYFGGRNGSGIFGLLVTSFGFGTFLGPAFAGVTFDLTASYVLPISVSALAAVAAAACMVLLEDPAGWRKGYVPAIAGLPRK